MNQRRAASSAVLFFFVGYYSYIASTTWNRGLTRSDQQSARVGDQTGAQGEGTPISLDFP